MIPLEWAEPPLPCGEPHCIAPITTPSKLSVIDVLRNGQPRTFRLNGEDEVFGNCWGVRHNPPATEPWPQNRDLDEATMHRLLEVSA